MPTPGILVAKSHLLSSTTITPETFIHWYHNIHIPDVLASQGAPPLAIHYTNVDPSAKWVNLVAFRLPDINWLGSEEMRKIPKEWNGWEGPGGKPRRGIEFAEITFRAYEQVHVYEGPQKKPQRGSYIVTVGIDIPDDMEEEYDEWMRKQHLPMVSMVPVFRRSTRYTLPPEKRDANWPKILVITEYDEPPSPELMQITRTTEWGSRIIGAFKTTDKQGWSLVKEFGKAREGVDLS